MRYDNGCSSKTWINYQDVGWCGQYPGSVLEEEGLLYQWSAAMNGSTTEGAQGICPTGFHIPTDAEWHALESSLTTGTCNNSRNGIFDCAPAGSSLGGNSTILAWTAGALSSHTSFNSSKFSALPTGIKYWQGAITERGRGTAFWASGISAQRTLGYNNTGTQRNLSAAADAYSIRCLKDQTH